MLREPSRAIRYQTLRISGHSGMRTRVTATSDGSIRPAQRGGSTWPSWYFLAPNPAQTSIGCPDHGRCPGLPPHRLRETLDTRESSPTPVSINGRFALARSAPPPWPGHLWPRHPAGRPPGRLCRGGIANFSLHLSKQCALPRNIQGARQSNCVVSPGRDGSGPWSHHVLQPVEGIHPSPLPREHSQLMTMVASELL
jgi:hypothetical protein